jgi:hypothetical protein
MKIIYLLLSLFTYSNGFTMILNKLTNINPNTIFKSSSNLQYNSAYTYIAGLNYNPFNIIKQSFITNFNVEPNSLYINYQLSKDQINQIKENIPDYLEIIPIQLLENEKKKYLLSVNIYNVTSVLFGKNVIPRLECNIYVKDKKTNEIGTMILSYTSTSVSFDPINLLKFGNKNNLIYNIENDIIKIQSHEKNFEFNLELDKKILNQKHLSKQLIRATDQIYYQNGIIEKMYYDSAFVFGKVNCIKINKNINSLNFFIPGSDITLDCDKIDSSFIFSDVISFTCKTWSNRNTINKLN